VRNFQGLKCWFCGYGANSREHLKPRDRGGSCKKGNIVPACNRCNSTKSRMTVEEFRRELVARAARFDASPNWWRIIRMIKPFAFTFYGERNTVDGKFPLPCESKAKSRWSKTPKRKQGPIEVRMEEVAKRGAFAEVQGGLMNGN
jgi:hypothetical protein